MVIFNTISNLNSVLKDVGSLGIFNFVGLVFALVAAILLAALIRYDFAFDYAIDPDAQVFTLYTKIIGNNGKPLVINGTNQDLASAVAAQADDYTVGRVSSNGILDVKLGARRVPVRLYSFDPSVADIFELPVLHGSVERALASADGVVLTESVARNIFGAADVVGKSLDFENSGVFRIGAIVPDWPKNVRLSRIEGFISSTSSFSELSQTSLLGSAVTASNRIQTYIRAKNYQTIEELVQLQQRLTAIATSQVKAMQGRLNANVADSTRVLSVEAFAERLRDAYFAKKDGEPAISNPWRGDLTATIALAVIAVLVVVIAALNFINLSTSNAYRKITEVAVFKAYGVLPHQIIYANLFRYAVVGVLAGIIAIMIAWSLIAWFSQLINKILIFDPLSFDSILVILFSAFVGLSSGLLPSTMAANLPLNTALNARDSEISSSVVLRNSLIGFQGFAAVLVMSLVGIIYAQLNYLTDDVLGFEDKNIVIYSLRAGEYSRDFSNALAELAKNDPDVTGFTMSNATPFGGVHSVINAELSGVSGDNRNSANQLRLADVDHAFFDIYGVKVIAGRSFITDEVKSYRLNAEKSIRPVILSEAALNEFGITNAEDAIGQRVRVTQPRSWTGEVVGVVKNVPIGVLRSDHEQANIFTPQVTDASSLTVKFNSVDVQATANRFDEIITELNLKRNTPNRFFAEQRVTQEYGNLNSLLKLVSFFALLALAFSALGVLGLSVTVGYRMTKEASVRKVFGADNWYIALLMMVRVMSPIVIGAILAFPLTFVIGSKWLDGYRQAIEMNLFYPGAALILVMFVCILTIQFQVYRISRTKPIEALRYD